MNKITVFLLSVGLMTVAYPGAASAGLFDSIKAAANKISQQAQQGQNGTDEDHPIQLQGQGHCHGQGGATCTDYGEVVDQCMDPVRGYRMKVLGDRIDQKLKNEKLSDQQRKNLEEDMTAAKEAYKNKSDDPTIAGKASSQRYLSDISEEDQMWVNAEYGRFRNKIYNKCIGADHMQTGHRTEMITDMGPSGDEAVAEYRKEHTRRRPSSDNNCLQAVSGIRYRIMGDMMQKKMQTLKLSDKERNEWLQDIEAVRQVAAAGGTSMPKVDDPTNPYRPLTRLSSPEEQSALNTQYSNESRAVLDACKQSGR
jgi:hypothetical protein